MHDPARLLVRPREKYPSKRHGTVVWTYASVRIHGTVAREDGSSGASTVLAAVVHGDLPVSGPAGTMAWFDQNSENRGIHRATLEQGQWEVRVPAFGTIGLLAFAPGFAFATAEIDVRPDAADYGPIHLVLKRAPLAVVQVENGKGEPVRGANVQLWCARKGTMAEIDPKWGFLYREATGSPYTFKSFPSPNAAQEALTIWATTDTTGAVRVQSPIAASEYMLLVRGKGYRVFEWAASDLGTYPARIRLVRPDAAAGKYRFVHQGETIRNGTLYLCEERHGWNPVFPPIECDPQGWFDCGYAERDVEYLAIIKSNNGENGVVRGKVILGSEEYVHVRAP